MRRALLAAALLLLPALAVASPRWLGEAPDRPPARIVTLAPSLSAIVIDLGAAERLVGVSRYDDAPEVEALPRVGGFLDPAPEAILRLEPDLILAQPSPGNRGAVERLAALGVPVLVVRLDTVEQTLEAVRAVGAAIGRPADGEARAAAIRAGLDAARARVRDAARPRVLLVYGWQPLVVAGPNSFAHELIEAAGGINVAAAARGAYPTLSAEAALAAAPALVIDATGGHGEGTPPPGLAARVRRLRSPGVFQPGPRMLEALAELEDLLRAARGERAQAPGDRGG